MDRSRMQMVSVHLSIYLSIDPSIYPSIYLVGNLYVDAFGNLFPFLDPSMIVPVYFDAGCLKLEAFRRQTSGIMNQGTGSSVDSTHFGP